MQQPDQFASLHDGSSVVLVLVIMTVVMRVIARVLVIVVLRMIASMLVIVATVIMGVIASVLVTVAVVLRMTVSVLVIMPMFMRVTASVLVTVPVVMRMTVSVFVIMPMMLAEHLLRDRIIFCEGLVVPMLVTAAIRASLRRKRPVRLLDRHPEPAQHVRKHWIVFKLQIPVADLDRCVPIAEVIGRTRECERRSPRNPQHGLRCRDDAYESAIFVHEDVTVREHGAARQHHADLLAGIQRGREPALAPFVEGKCQHRGARKQRLREPRAGRNEFVQRSHRYGLALRHSIDLSGMGCGASAA